MLAALFWKVWMPTGHTQCREQLRLQLLKWGYFYNTCVHLCMISKTLGEDSCLVLVNYCSPMFYKTLLLMHFLYNYVYIKKIIFDEPAVFSGRSFGCVQRSVIWDEVLKIQCLSVTGRIGLCNIRLKLSCHNYWVGLKFWFKFWGRFISFKLGRILWRRIH